MKVLEINVDDVGLGGVFSLVRSVIRHKPADVQMDLAGIVRFEDPKHVEELAQYGSHVYYIGTDGGKLSRPAAYYKNTKALIERKGYDCVHIHGDVAYLLRIFARAARKAGVSRIILHSHAAGIDGGARGLKKVLHGICRRSLKKYGTVFAACSDVAARWMYPNVPEEKVVMIRNGVDLKRFAFDPEVRAKAREELGVGDLPVIGHVGRFAYQKNHAFLLEVFRRYHEQYGRARLLLVGEGVLMAEIRAKAREMKEAAEDIQFYGASSKVEDLLQAMDVFVLPSHFEGLPVVGVEAQAAGLPVLFSDAITREAELSGGVRFLPIGEGDAGKWAEQIHRILQENTEERERQRAEGCRKLAEAGFDIEDTVRAFLALYRV